MTPDIAQLAGTLGPTAAVLIFMWLNRAPTAKEKAEDPVAKMAERLNAIERIVSETHTDVRILMDRRQK